MHFGAVQPKDEVVVEPFHRVFVILGQRGRHDLQVRLPVTAVTIALVLDDAQGIVVGAAVAVMLEYVDFPRSGHGPADILVRFLDRGLIVPGAEQPPGREHSMLAAVEHPQPGRPFSPDEFLAVFRCDSAGHVTRGRIEIAVLVQVVAGELFTHVHDAQFQRSAADLAGAEAAVRQIALVFVVDPQQLVLPMIGIEGIEVVEEVGSPCIGGVMRIIRGLHARTE